YHPANGTKYGVRQGRDNPQERADEIVVGVDDVEGHQPTHDHGNDDDPLVDSENLIDQESNGVQHKGVVPGGTAPEKPENHTRLTGERADPYKPRLAPAAGVPVRGCSSVGRAPRSQ